MTGCGGRDGSGAPPTRAMGDGGWARLAAGRRDGVVVGCPVIRGGRDQPVKGGDGSR